ncbi:LysR family transcriptional regulator [Pseudomonas sp. SJZ103]|jgi:DNA-binding transcriptional LysR family regulator|uniref:LysR family transcriptional regulator n=1 Tax=unclassified Pseudomonas TaxID=196821 RepID=UPI001040CE4F|nr:MULTISPECIES: LysR family transcriptional regulator [unclassified Pseudomonas]MBB6288024.1 DNA-binding transcriptional LysR family regulator [Pseudomonas sp. SJZ073]MBB6312996.1 DNA-binding transcriptional LysR family regulator [Pseudomonas sp. JAI120]MCS4310537.1 DNA-binding transcriptional LysR family regulator [Pseudomonas sp. BIGb0381]NJJ59637.1 LysR family transcriptional regulator [Pseudomonas sp. B14(2022)]TWC75126.1 LysR family transcriptional regulator [Pseudomonas sp. SJZ103]
MLDLRKLRYFLTVAEELHFGRAALRLHLAQPPLTRQISALEADLGFKLFDRTSRTVTLTAQGRSFLPYARGVLEQVELAQVIAGKLAAGTAGQLALGYVSSIALSDLFSQSIQAFAQRFPDVQLTLVECASGSLGAQVADGRLDIGLSRLLPQNDKVHALSLGEERLVAAVSSDSPLADQAGISLAQLGAYPLILFPADYGSGLNQSIEQLYRHHGVPLHAGPTGRQITSIIALVAAGQGVALVPACTQSLMNKGVTYRPLVEADACARLLVLTRREEPNLSVQAFIALIDEVARAR